MYLKIRYVLQKKIITFTKSILVINVMKMKIRDVDKLLIINQLNQEAISMKSNSNIDH